MKTIKETELTDFNMTIQEAVSHIKARTCNIDFLLNHRYQFGYQLRRSLNNRSFILNDSNGMLELFISTDGFTIQDVIEDFDNAVSEDSKERGILQKDLDVVRLKIKRYKK